MGCPDGRELMPMQATSAIAGFMPPFPVLP